MTSTTTKYITKTTTFYSTKTETITQTKTETYSGSEGTTQTPTLNDLVRNPINIVILIGLFGVGLILGGLLKRQK